MIMTRTLEIPHQRVTLDSGETGTLRATLATTPDGEAQGHLALATRAGARRYRAVCGTICPAEPGQGLKAALQLQGLATQDGIEELVELQLRDALDDEPGAVLVSLRRLPDGEPIAACRARLETA